MDNDGLHGMEEESGIVALKAGFHPINVTFFERSGGQGLIVSIKGPDMSKQTLTQDMLFH